MRFMLVAYEALDTASLATNVLALIAREAGDSLEIQVAMWRSDSFNSPPLREVAVRHAHHRCRTREPQRRPVVSGLIVAGTITTLVVSPETHWSRMVRGSMVQ